MSDSDSWQDSSSDSDTDQRSESDDSAPDLSDVRTWCPIDCGMDEVPPPRFPFTGSPGMKVDVEHNDPLAYLKLFLTDDVIEKIVTETNRYNEQQSATLRSKFSRNRKWEPVTKEDIWKFLGLILLTGVVGKPLQKWYWTTNKLLATPFFGTIMSECRFSLIMKNLHFTNNEEFDEATHPAPKLKKIWEVYQMILKNFQQSYVPDRDISIDESLMAYKGRLSWIQYIASKRARFGIKSYMLCESATGYIWNSVIYTEQNLRSVSFSSEGVPKSCGGLSHLEAEWSLNQEVFDQICDLRGALEVDHFALGKNHKLMFFFPLNPSDPALEVDTLAHDWPFSLAHAFPPVRREPNFLEIRVETRNMEYKPGGISLAPPPQNMASQGEAERQGHMVAA
ncbi:piggyBac transposable element-derived protein 4-like [Gastrophryne carolinensis]